MSKITNFKGLLIHQLRDLLSSARQMSMIVPKMEELAQDKKLKNVFGERAESCEQHVRLITECLESLDAPTTPETCQAMVGLITEGNNLLESVDDLEVRDAALIVISQRIQHYEIAGYGTAKSHAEQLDIRSVAEKLDVILKQEKKLDKKLSKIADSYVNEKAMATA